MKDGLKEKHRKAIVKILSDNKRVQRVVLFGSRATKTFTTTSDVDLSLFGDELTLTDEARLARAIDELPIAQRVELLRHSTVDNKELLRHIRKHGVEWFSRQGSPTVWTGRQHASGGLNKKHCEAKVATLSHGRQMEGIAQFSSSGVAHDWQQSRLGDIAVINPSRPLVKGTDSVYISMRQVESGNRKIAAIVRRCFRGSGSRFLNGDTLLARITPSLENGKTAYVDFLEDMEIAHGSTEFIVLSAREGISDELFIYYLARSPEFRNFAIVRMDGSSGRQRVPAPTLKEYAFPSPPYGEQRAIARILGALDDKIELNRRMNQTLEAMASAIFQSWFVDFDPVHAKAEGRDTGLPDEIAAWFPASFEESKLGRIPKGWKAQPLDYIADLINGLACQKYPVEQTEESLPVIKIRELRHGITTSTDRATVNVPSDYVIVDRDILFSWSGSLLIDVWTQGRGVLNQHLFKVTSEHYPKWFLYYWVRNHLADFQWIAACKATTMGHIKRHHLHDAKAYVPDDEVLQLADEHINPLFEKMVQNKLETQALAALRDVLLPKLISGELRVLDTGKFATAVPA